MAIAIPIIVEGATAIGEGIGLMEGGAAITGGGLAAGGIISQQQRQRSGGLVPTINHHQRQAQQEQQNAIRNINFDNIRNALSPITQPVQDEQMAPLPNTNPPKRTQEELQQIAKQSKENKKRGRPKKQPVQEEQKQNRNTGEEIVISEQEYQQAYQSQSLESLQSLLDQLESQEESKDQTDNDNTQRQINVVRRLIQQKQIPQQQQQQIIQNNNDQEMNGEQIEFEPMNEEDEKIDIDESNQRPSDIKRGHTGGNPGGDDPPPDRNPNEGDERINRWINRAQQIWGYIPNIDPVLKAYEEHQKNKTDKSREDLIKRFEKLNIDELERISKQAHKFDEFDIEGDLLDEK